MFNKHTRRRTLCPCGEIFFLQISLKSLKMTRNMQKWHYSLWGNDSLPHKVSTPHKAILYARVSPQGCRCESTPTHRHTHTRTHLHTDTHTCTLFNGHFPCKLGWLLLWHASRIQSLRLTCFLVVWFWVHTTDSDFKLSSWIKSAMNNSSLSLRSASWRSFTMPYFHVVSQTFSRSKKIAVVCCLWIKA